MIARRLARYAIVLFIGIAIGSHWMAMNYQLY